MNARRLVAVSLWLGFVVVLFAEAASEDESDAKPQADEAQVRKALVGVWKGFAVEGKGENPDRGPVKIELNITEKTIHGYQIQQDNPVDQGEGEYKLDLSAAPRTLDGTRPKGNGRNDTWLGIYTLEGDTLKWCVSHRTRPTEFETVQGQFLLILKREKSAK